MSLPRALILLVGLAGAGSVEGATALFITQASSATLSLTIPITFSAGQDASSTLGVNATRATTSLALSKTKTDFPSLLIERGSPATARSISLRFNSATGLANVSAATIKVAGVTQIVITSGSVTQTSGSTVALAAGGNVTFAGIQMAKKAAGNTATLVIDATSTSASGAGGTLTQTWTINIT